MRINCSRSWVFSRRLTCRWLIVVLLCALGTPTIVWASHQVDLTEIGIEELMDMEITSVSRHPQKISDSAAAVFVITQEDIRRSGVTSIPEALRMVPGIEVARLGSNKWAVSSRGFNGRFANKLLVLMDGRSLYSPFFSGVFWEMQDTLLEDIDRIEVIRGPGAALWGANAVNGVINIITKDAAKTQGDLVTAGAGTEERGFVGLRHGGKLGEDSYYRIYGKYFDRDDFVTLDGESADDDWRMAQGGFRLDTALSHQDSLTLQGDIFNGQAGSNLDVPELTPPYSETLHDDSRLSGFNLLSRWTRDFSSSAEVNLQAYYDHSEYGDPAGRDIQDTLDIDFQHRFVPAEHHELLWGLGFRQYWVKFENSATVSLDPDHRSFSLFTGFLQDDIYLIEDRLRLTLGSKFEHNELSGWEVQPNLRLLWRPAEGHTFWAAASRAVRTPSTVENDGRINLMTLPPDSLYPGSPPALVSLFASPDFEPEEVKAFEIGYRVQPADAFFIDVATFYNLYDQLRSLMSGTPFLETDPAPAHLVVPSQEVNQMSGRTYGVEVAADWQALPWWNLRLAFSTLQILLKVKGNSADTTSESIEGDSPHYLSSLRSQMDLSKRLQLDLWLRCVDKIPNQNVAGYLTLDVRLGWHFSDDLELSLVGQNLFDNQHPEGVTEFLSAGRSEVPRGVFGKIDWRF
jgi:iron complex outermembrane recepter protein